MSGHEGAALLLDALPPARVIIADHGYDSDCFRAALSGRGITPCIPPRRNRKVQHSYDATLYREAKGSYDRIVSLGVLQHVGSPYYPVSFATLRRLLAEDGLAPIHGPEDGGPGLTNPWTREYIFLGGYIPALSEILPVVERAGLIVADIELLRLQYAEALKQWRERYLAPRALIADIYDDRFCRMWGFYRAGSEMGFRYDKLMVFQIPLARRIDTIPLTCDYTSRAETAYAG